jgi:hypothetical protein
MTNSFDVKEFAMNSAWNSGILYGAEKMGLDKFVQDNNTLMRNVKRSGYWYLVSESRHSLKGEPSNFTDFKVSKLVDDMVFNTLSSFIVEQLDIFKNLNNVGSEVITNRELENAISEGLIIQTVEELQNKFGGKLSAKVNSLLGFSDIN